MDPELRPPTPNEVKVLQALYLKRPLPLGRTELVESTGISPSSVYDLLNRLVTLGWLEVVGEEIHDRHTDSGSFKMAGRTFYTYRATRKGLEKLARYYKERKEAEARKDKDTKSTESTAEPT